MRLHSCRALPLVICTLACSGSDADESALVETPAADTQPALPPTAPAATDPFALPAGEAAVGDYRLSLADLEKWAAATRGIRSRARQNPLVGAKLAAIPPPRTLAEMEAAYRAIPETAQAIEQAGLDLHDFAVIGFTFAQSALAADSVRAGASPGAVAQSMRISPENIDFVQQNQAAIARVLQSIAAGE